MARPRVFVSSTYYDLKHIRGSLEAFIESLGYEAVLSEHGDIAYTPDQPLDASCYREVTNADILVLVVGGRYGSPASGEGPMDETRYEPYVSVTRTEYETAVSKDIPVYILVDQNVLAEYQTYRQNRENGSMRYAQVDTINVYRFLDDIYKQRRNNPVQAFNTYGEIEEWLRDQWAGYFRELLRSRANSEQLRSLEEQVSQLNEINETLRRYMEALLRATQAERSKELIDDETKRLRLEAMRRNPLVQYLIETGVNDLEDIHQALVSTDSASDFLDEVFRDKAEETHGLHRLKAMLDDGSANLVKDLRNLRRIVGRAAYPDALSRDADPGLGALLDVSDMDENVSD